jgi:hypothetical protein
VIKEITITNIDTLIHHLNSLPNHFIYRGQANALWRLESTLERAVGSKWNESNAKKFEEYSYESFRSKYQIYKHSEHTPKSKLSWLSVMQHYGVPTRLLDFTESPYIALYFALESYNPLLGEDFSIYAIDYTSVMDRSLEFIRKNDSKFTETRNEIHGQQDTIFDDIVDRFSYNILWITEPVEQNARMDRQSGTFLISGNRGRTIESVIESNTYNNCELLKFVISHPLYQPVYALLRKVGINAKSIYGDLTGLAKSIKMELQAHTV